MKIKREGNIKEAKWETKKFKTRKSNKKRRKKEMMENVGKEKNMKWKRKKERKTGANIEID